MSKRLKRNSITSFSASSIAKMRSADYLLNSLSAGSKNRLKQYMRNLQVTRGDSEDGRNFDHDLLEVIKPFIKDKAKFNSVKRYLHNLKCEDGYPYSRSLKIYKSTEDGMMRFAQPDYTSFRWNANYQKSLKYFRSVVSQWKLKPLNFNSDDEVKAAIPKMVTHSGYTYIESGFKEKGKNMDGIYQRYKTAEEEAFIRGSFSRPIMTAFRTQVSGEFNQDGSFTYTGKHKCRTVCMVDLLQIIGELHFAKPVQSRMSYESWYAGGKDENEIGMIIHDFHANYPYFSSTDYSSYDQTISSWLIEDAFDVLKCAFVGWNDFYDQLYSIVVHDFIHKDFITAHGILHSDKGIPSGSMFTQIIGSLINCIVMTTFYFAKEHDSIKMITMGDDNASFSTDKFDIEDMASYISKNFGIIVKTDDKTMYGGPDDDVKFLSRYWTISGPVRNVEEIIARLLYSERPRPYDDEVTPAHVILAFVLTYRNMSSLIDVAAFRRKYPIGDVDAMKVDSRYIPGALAYIRDYTCKGRHMSVL